jgi:hypothetical protein
VLDKDRYTKTVKRVKPKTKIIVSFFLLSTHVAEYFFIISKGSIIKLIYRVPKKQQLLPFINIGCNFLLSFLIAFNAISSCFSFYLVKPLYI